MLTFDSKDIYLIVDENLGQRLTRELRAQSLDFLLFPDLEEAFRDDLAFLRKSELVL